MGRSVHVFISFSILLTVDVLSQKPCCGPNKWSAVAVQKLGRYDRSRSQDVASVANQETNIAYDYDGRKIALTHMIHNISTDVHQKIHRILDYNKKKEWTINGKKCTSSNLTMPITSPCVPDAAIQIGQYNMSGPMVSLYHYVTPDTGSTVRFGMTYGSCLLTTESLLQKTTGPVYTLTVSIYENVTQGIPDMSVFDVPSFCPPSKKTSTKMVLSQPLTIGGIIDGISLH